MSPVLPVGIVLVLLLLLAPCHALPTVVDASSGAGASADVGPGPRAALALPDPLARQSNTVLFEQINNSTYVDGASAVDITVLGDDVFVAVAQEKNDAGEYGIHSTICSMDEEGALTPVVTFPTQGAVEVRWLPIADSEHPDCVYLFVGNGNDGETVNVNSTVYRFDGQSLTVVQHLLTHSVGRVAFLPAYGSYYLMVPNGNNGATPYIDSVLYGWRSETSRFDVVARVSTRGALSACEVFLEGLPHVFIGNAFGDSVLYFIAETDELIQRQAITLYNPSHCVGWRRGGVDYLMVAIHYSQGQYLTDSFVYRWESGIGQLAPFANIQTQGATHLTHLIHNDGEHYLHVANLRDANYRVESVMYRQTDSGFETEQGFAGKGRSGFACVGMGDALRCVAADSDDGQSRRHPLVVYEETLHPWVPPPSMSASPMPSKPPTSGGNGGSDLSDGEWAAIVLIVAFTAAVITGVSVALYYRRKRPASAPLLGPADGHDDD